MTTALPTTEVFEQFTTKAVEGLGILGDANQKVLRQLVDLSTATASEGVRVFTELQASALSAVKTGQDFLLAQQTRLQNLPKDPISVAQKGVLDGVEGAQHAFKLLEAGADTVTKSAERLQGSAEKVGRDLQGTFAALAEDLKSLYVVEPKAV